MKKIVASWPMRLSFFFVVLILTVLIGVFWWQDGVSPVDKNDQSSVMFIIKRGEPVQSIVNRLAAERLIRSKVVFFLLIKFEQEDRNIQAGDFRLKRSMTAHEVLKELQHGAIDIWVTILEGWRVEEIAERLSNDLRISSQEFLAIAREGYMFPDTYLFPKDASASAIVAILQKNFDRRVPESLREKSSHIGLSFEEVVILASLVEREGRGREDKRMIAGILLNRLREGMKLDVDATLQYIIGYDTTERTWWKKGLTNDHKKIDSPYNTYMYKGLPPGPICNPGLLSIEAVLDPIQSDYFFYLHDKQGTLHYAKTLDEHERNIARYLR